MDDHFQLDHENQRTHISATQKQKFFGENAKTFSGDDFDKWFQGLQTFQSFHWIETKSDA